MDYRVKGVLLKNRTQLFLYGHVRFVEFRAYPCNLFDFIQCFFFGIIKVIEDNHFMSGLNQFHTGMGADISGSSADKNSHAFASFYVFEFRVILR